MSQTLDKPTPVRCSDVHFAEVDFPAAIQPRLVIEYLDGLKIIIADHADLALAADLIAEVRRRSQSRQKGGSK